MGSYEDTYKKLREDVDTLRKDDFENMNTICKWFDELKLKTDNQHTALNALNGRIDKLRDDLYNLQKLVTDKRTKEEKTDILKPLHESIKRIKEYQDFNTAVDKRISKSCLDSAENFANQLFNQAEKLGLNVDRTLDPSTIRNSLETGEILNDVEKSMRQEDIRQKQEETKTKIKDSEGNEHVIGIENVNLNSTYDKDIEGKEYETNPVTFGNKTVDGYIPGSTNEHMKDFAYNLDHPYSLELRFNFVEWDRMGTATSKVGLKSISEFIRVAIQSQISEINKIEKEIKKNSSSNSSEGGCDNHQ